MSLTSTFEISIKVKFWMAASKRSLNHKTRDDILNIFQCEEVNLPIKENTNSKCK